MNIIALRQFVTADANHTIHIQLPPEIPDQVEVIVLPVSTLKTNISEEGLMRAKLTDESGFVNSVLNNPEEDCWNDL